MNLKKSAARALALVAMLSWSLVAWAGSYLDRSALLVTESRQTSEWLFAHLGDKELAELAHPVTVARVKSAQKMTVPKEVVGAHPHLLLSLEAAERAAAAATRGENDKFIVHLRQSRDEEQMFRHLLAQQKLQLPNVK